MRPYPVSPVARLHQADSDRALPAARRARASLLYVTPVCPSLTGSGTPMRAGIVLEALAARYRVSMLVVPAPQYAGFNREVPTALRTICDNVNIVSPDGNLLEKVQRAGRVYRDEKFDVVHVFRLVAVPYAQPYLINRRRTKFHLDIDDIESKTHGRIAALYRRAGDLSMATDEEWNARRCQLLEADALRTFDRIYVCSELDRMELASRCARIEGSKAAVCILRNAVRLPDAPPGGVFRFLFVGTLSYYPNEDGIRFFCEDILPLLREMTRRPFVIDIIGRDGSRLRKLSCEDVNVIGDVADVGPYYQACDAVIVPLRAGGGTRIKILEAFSYKRPVVTTSIGVEGIDVTSGQHALVADTPEAFGSACLQLISDPRVGRRLVENATALLHQLHTVEHLKRVV